MRMLAQVHEVAKCIKAKDTELSRDSDLTMLTDEVRSKHHKYLRAGSGQYSQLLNYINKSGHHGKSRVDSSLLTQHISNYSKNVGKMKSHKQISSQNKRTSA